jgi:hypothetical protein
LLGISQRGSLLVDSFLRSVRLDLLLMLGHAGKVRLLVGRGLIIGPSKLRELLIAGTRWRHQVLLLVFETCSLPANRLLRAPSRTEACVACTMCLEEGLLSQELIGLSLSGLEDVLA